MRILYLTQYFPPENGATQARAWEMASNWVRLGHQVTVLCEIPNHPAGVIRPGYRGKIVVREELSGIDVIHLWVKASQRKTFFNRLLFYLSFMVHSTLAGLTMTRGRFDLIYASSPPLFVGAAALTLGFLRRTPLVFEVRDLWPDSAIELGELSSRSAIRWARRLEEACYRRARAVVVVTEGIRNRLLARGIAAEKILLIPNGANAELFRFLPDERRRVRRELGLQDKFVVLYAGLHGLAADLECVLVAAERLVDHPTVQFLLVGEGPRKGRLVALAEKRGLKNVRFLPEQPREDLPALFSAADATVAPLRKLPILEGALPVKMFDAWACERPVVLLADGEARNVLEAAGGGIVAPPESIDGLADAVLELEANAALRRTMGTRGRAYVEAEFSRRKLAEDLIERLENLRRRPSS
jgi:glycosyltransferase involved in cell wall biosynthesis